MEEDSVFGVAWVALMQRKLAPGLAVSFLGILALLTTTSKANPPNVKGKISGFEKLVPEIYMETAKPDSRRWTWREPSPSVAAKDRILSANPSRDICIAATTNANQEPNPLRVTVTGGRAFPTTIVVPPNSKVAFVNADPFKHRIYVQSAAGQKLLNAEDLAPQGNRSWSPQGAGKYEVRDELFPSIRTYILVDPQVAQIAYPDHNGAFGFSLPNGDYVLKVFFNGKPVGKQINFTAKEKGVFDIKEPIKLDEGDAK